MKEYCGNCEKEVAITACEIPHECEDAPTPEHAHCGDCGSTVPVDAQDKLTP